jgi:hypothetical protein
LTIIQYENGLAAPTEVNIAAELAELDEAYREYDQGNEAQCRPIVYPLLDSKFISIRAHANLILADLPTITNDRGRHAREGLL